MEGTKDIFLAFLEYEEGIYDRRNFIDAPEIGKTYVAFLDLTGARSYTKRYTQCTISLKKKISSTSPD